MNIRSKHIPILGLLLMAPMLAIAADLGEISNYRQYSPQFSSSGQPSASQLEAVEQDGFRRVIYLAFSDDHTAIDKEDRVVKELGMDYVHIPVDFENPTIEDFEDFSAVMNRDGNTRTLLHCQINWRASTFSFSLPGSLCRRAHGPGQGGSGQRLATGPCLVQVHRGSVKTTWKISRV